MVFSFDVSTIIISYLKLDQLFGFCSEFGVDYRSRSRFMFDGSIGEGDMCIFKYFPNIVLKNMYLDSSRIVDACSIHLLASNVLLLSIKRADDWSIKLLCLFEKLECVVLDGCEDNMKLFGMERCVNLHTVKMLFNNEYINDDDVRVLSMCSNLKRLELRGCFDVTSQRGYNNFEKLSCGNLRHFKYVCREREMGRYCSFTCGNFSCIRECTNLRTFRLEGCGLKKLGELNCDLVGISLKGCDRLEDINVLGKCEKLRWIDLRGCTSLRDIFVLKKCEKLRIVDLRGCVSLDLGDGRCEKYGKIWV